MTTASATAAVASDSATAGAAPAALARSLSPLHLFAMAFGSIVGIGWITLVGVWLQTAGPLGAVLGFALGGVAVLLVALTYAEVALLIPRAGAEVVYAQEAFGRGAAFAVGWLLLLVYGAVIAFEMISVGWVLGTIWPAMRGEVIWTLGGRPSYSGELYAGLAAMLVITIANARAADLAARGQVVLMVLKVGVSVVFILAALARGDAEHLEPGFAVLNRAADAGVAAAAGAPAGAPAGIAAGVLSVFAVSLLFYSGFNFLAQGLEERDERVRPAQVVRAMLASLVLAFVFYALVIVSTAMVLPPDRIAGLDLPAASAFELAFGSRTLRDLVLLAGLLGLVTAWNGTLFAASRIALMLGREALLPAPFARLSRTGRTPIVALLAISALGTLLGLAGRAAVEPIVTVAATAIPLTWAVVAAAAWRLRRTRAEAERPYRVPLGRLVFALAFLAALLAFGVAARDVLGAGAGLTLGAIALLVWAALGGVLWFLQRGARHAPQRRAEAQP